VTYFQGVKNSVHHTVEQSFTRFVAVHCTKPWNEWLHAFKI